VLKGLDARAAFLPVETASRESVQRLLDETLRQFGQVDMLVNCAGLNSAEPYFEIKDETFDAVVATNLKATHLGCQIFGRHMAAQSTGGSILNIGSVSAAVPL